jgi:glyoxylase-like metal-dependent hydrolase (beta-lactamase superfamily II)
MKTLRNVSLAMMAISLGGCAGAPNRAQASQGRIIEFKAGPEGFDTRTFFYEGAQEVIAFDAHFTPDLAKQSIAELRKHTDKPITWLVITHPNPDKFNGASVFREEGAKIIASEATALAIPGVHAYKEYFFVEMAKMFPRGTYPHPVAVDETFRGAMDLVLRGGERIELRELSQAGVSSTQTVAYVKASRALFVGDLVHHQAHAWLEGGIVDGKPVPTLGEWEASLREIAKLYPEETLVYGGRGETAMLREAVPAQISYLKRARKIVRNDLTSRGDRARDYLGGNAGTLYK